MSWLHAQSEMLTPIELQVKEHKKNIVVEGNLKGFSPVEIKIEVEGDVLKVFGSHSESALKEENDAAESVSESVAKYKTNKRGIESRISPGTS